VKFFRSDTGWGAVTSRDLSHDVWVHFSSIEAAGYRDLNEGDKVEFRAEACFGSQDSWHYRSTRVRRIDA